MSGYIVIDTEMGYEDVFYDLSEIAKYIGVHIELVKGAVEKKKLIKDKYEIKKIKEGEV